MCHWPGIRRSSTPRSSDSALSQTLRSPIHFFGFRVDSPTLNVNPKGLYTVSRKSHAASTSASTWSTVQKMCAELSAYTASHATKRELTVILDETPHTGEARKSATRLVSVQDTKLGESERQLLVRSFSSIEDETVSGAVHWLDGELVLLHLELEHVLGVVLPVSGRLPQLRVEQVRRADWLLAMAQWTVQPDSPSEKPRLWYSACTGQLCCGIGSASPYAP